MASAAGEAAIGASAISDVLSIEGEMTIYRAVELKQILLAQLAQPGAAIRLDLSWVTELDSAGVQLLLLVKQLAAVRKKVFHLVGCSDAVEDVLRLLNLQAYFEPGHPPSVGAQTTREDASP